jgi:hypothetical protein
MFEKMMKHEKAWQLFCKWLKEEKATISTEIAILAIMPFFFDEYEIIIEILRDVDGWEYLIGIGKDCKKENAFMRYDNMPYLVSNFLSRKKALQKDCEKAFEILEGQNV